MQLCVASQYQALPEDNYCFQGHKVPVHRARVTETLIDENEIKTIDLNIIENVWLENEIWVLEKF